MYGEENYKIAIIVMPILAVITLVSVILKMKSLVILQNKFKQAIVLVPLYKKRFSLLFSVFMLFLCDVACFYFMVKDNYVIIYFSLITVITSMIVLMVYMVTFRLAVMDKGILVPYRFIEWHHLYDYYIERYKVSFGGNDNGLDTLTSNTPPLKFNVADLNKIKYILDKNRVKHKTNMR